ncbi:histone-fold-containing protein [Hyaloraphidium curvatum]|nr:histone-fold-containing protein [Hyaloraphidium curvatum]
MASTPSGLASPPGEPAEGAADESAAKATAPSFPLSRVRKIMKEDKDVQKLSQDGVVAVAFSTEIFLGYLLERAYEYAQKDKRKTVMYKDIAAAVRDIEQLEFLRDVIPAPLPLKDAMKLSKDIQALY